MFKGPSKRSGKDYNYYDVLFVCSHYYFDHSKRNSSGSRERFGILSGSEFPGNEGTRHYDSGFCGDGSIFLYLKLGNRSDCDFRKLYRQKPKTDRRSDQRRNPGYVSSADVGLGHLSSMLCFWSQRGQRTKAGIYYTAECV